MKAGLSFYLFLIPSVVSSNSACLPLQRPRDFEDMLLFRHELQESKSMASSKLPLGSRPPQSPDQGSRYVRLQETLSPLCSKQRPEEPGWQASGKEMSRRMKQFLLLRKNRLCQERRHRPRPSQVSKHSWDRYLPAFMAGANNPLILGGT